MINRLIPRSMLAVFMLALTTPTRGDTLHALAPRIDFNDALNPSACKLWNWDGAGPHEMVVVDAFKQRMVTSRTDSPSLWIVDPVEKRASVSGGPHFLLLSDVNADNKEDLVLVDGPRFSIWLFKSRSQAGEVAADIEGMLPTSGTTAAITAGDLEGDGKPDLLIYNGIAVAPLLIFDFASPNAVAREITEATSTKAAYTHRWDVAARPVVALSGVNASYEEVGNTKIYQIAQDRSLTAVEEIPGEGVFAELDGQFPPEFVDFSGRQFRGLGAIRAKSAGSWPVALEFTLDRYSGYRETLSSAADFDGDGREELVFASKQSSKLFGIESYGTPSEAVVAELPSFNDPVEFLDSVRESTLSKAHLTIFSRKLLSDALGNPVTAGGTGSRAWLWRDAFHSSLSRRFILGPRLAPDRMALADFNGDMHMDIGVLHAAEGAFSVFQGPNWNAPHYNRPQIKDGFTGNSLVVADFTGNQVPDVLLPKSRKISSIQTFRQSQGSDVSFSKIIDYEFSPFLSVVPMAPDRVYGAADFDMDNDIDTLIFDPFQETLVWAENQTGNGTAITQHPISLAGRWWVPESYGYPGRHEWLTQDQVLILDADLDGDPDVITVPSALGNRVTLHRNHGGSFSLQTLTDLTSWNASSPWPKAGHYPIGPPSHLVSGRFIQSQAPIQFLIFGRTSGALNETASMTVAHGSIGAMQYGPADSMSEFGSVAVCDFDGDGLDDLLTAGNIGQDPLGNITADLSIRFHRSNGDGTFADSLIVAMPRGLISQLLASDFTGDGRPDLMAASKETGMVELFTHVVSPAYPGYAAWIALFPGIDQATTADPDGDGLSNLLEFARGTPPDSRATNDTRIPNPPVLAEIRLSTFPSPYPSGTATHPRPRAANGVTCDVSLEVSADLISWFTPSYQEPIVSYDPEYPQWETLSWNRLFPWGDQQTFYRFKVIYRTSQ